MAIKPYVSGSVPESIDVGVVGDDGLSTPLNVTIAADAGTKHADAYTPEIAAKDGEADYRTRFRGALSEGAWSAWGTLPTIQPVTEAGTVMAVQGRWLSGDPATPRIARLVLPQTGITIVEGGELPPATDTGEGTDTGTVDTVRPLPDVTDSGEGADTAVLDSANDPSLGDISDTGEGADSATIDRVVVVPDVTDSGEGSDVGDIDVLLRPPALTSMTAGNASFTVTVGSVSGASSYDLRWKTSAGSTWTERANVGTGTETVSGLTNSTAYDVQARTVSASGVGVWGTTVNVTPAADVWYFDADEPPVALKSAFASSAPSHSLAPEIGNGWVYVAAGFTAPAMQPTTETWSVLTFSLTPVGSFSSLAITAGDATQKVVSFGRTYPAGTPVTVNLEVRYTTPPMAVFVRCGANSKVTVG